MRNRRQLQAFQSACRRKKVSLNIFTCADRCWLELSSAIEFSFSIQEYYAPLCNNNNAEDNNFSCYVIELCVVNLRQSISPSHKLSPAQLAKKTKSTIKIFAAFKRLVFAFVDEKRVHNFSFIIATNHQWWTCCFLIIPKLPPGFSNEKWRFYCFLFRLASMAKTKRKLHNFNLMLRKEKSVNLWTGLLFNIFCFEMWNRDRSVVIECAIRAGP